MKQLNITPQIPQIMFLFLTVLYLISLKMSAPQRMPYQPPSRNYRGQRGGYTPSGNSYRPQSPASMHGRKRTGNVGGHPGSPAHPASAMHGAEMRLTSLIWQTILRQQGYIKILQFKTS